MIEMHSESYQSLPDIYEAAQRQDGCFIWQRGRDSGGYGSLRCGDRTWRAHEIAWFLAGNERPDGYVLHHVCGNRACVRVDHLQLTTRAEHWIITKAEDPDFETKRVVALTRETCQQGHGDWYVSPTGKRQCRTCQREWTRRRKETS